MNAYVNKITFLQEWFEICVPLVKHLASYCINTEFYFSFKHHLGKEVYNIKEYHVSS